MLQSKFTQDDKYTLKALSHLFCLDIVVRVRSPGEDLLCLWVVN